MDRSSVAFGEPGLDNGYSDFLNYRIDAKGHENNKGRFKLVLLN